MISTGTTTFLDMYFQMEEVARVVEESGIRAVLSEGLIEANDGDEGIIKVLISVKTGRVRLMAE